MVVMGPARRLALGFAPEVVLDLRAIDRKVHSLLRREIARQLKNEPDVVNRNRKPLDDLPQPYGEGWELRCGPGNRFRVFYEGDGESLTVQVLAIAVKERNTPRIGREESER